VQEDKEAVGSEAVDKRSSPSACHRLPETVTRRKERSVLSSANCTGFGLLPEASCRIVASAGAFRGSASLA